VSRIAVLVPAGGAGERMGGARKAFLDLGGEPVLARCLRPFLRRPDVEWIVVALPVDVHHAPPAWLLADPRVRTVCGGATRTDSVRNALAAVPHDADIVIVHDAARPLVTGALIERCLRATTAETSAVPAVPVVDTIKAVDASGRVLATPDRAMLRAAQTPQAFPAAVLRRAHERAAADGVAGTDDAALVEHYGGMVVVVDGAPENLKITARADLVMAEALLALDAG
jgi:2-C-methyl-D-erythritol 4-phosphate cytidylyltransferase